MLLKKERKKGKKEGRKDQSQYSKTPALSAGPVGLYVSRIMIALGKKDHESWHALSLGALEK